MTFQERYQYNTKTDLLGKGGFSKVFKATDTLLNRSVALKVFSSEASEKYDLVAEIRRVIALEHPNLCRYYDVAFVESVNGLGDEEKIQIGVMEFLDGGDLKTYLRQNPQSLNKLLADTLEGLSFLHEHNIIHRDLKPQNILIKNTPKGPVAKITDFGISKESDSSHTSSSLLMGTIEYMAPEQFNPTKYGINGKINTNLDLWSFGLMTYELLMGESLFGNRGGNTSAEQVMSNILNDENIAEKINLLSEPYRTIIKLCLIKDANQRVKNAGDLLPLLQAGVSNPQIAIQQNETMVLPKPTATNEDTSLIQKEAISAATEIINQPEKPGKTKPKTLIVAAILAMIALVSGLLWWQLKPKSYGKLYPVMDAATTKWGMKDSATGNLVVSCKYDWVDSMYDGMSLVNIDKKFGYLDASGNEIVKPQYFKAGFFVNGVATVGQDSLWGLIDNSGKLLTDMKYYQIHMDKNGGIKAIGFITMINATGNIYLDRSGKEVANAVEGGDFSEGLVYLRGTGYIDTAGKVVIPDNFDNANDFKEGVAFVQEKSIEHPYGGKWAIIDKLGKQISPYKFNINYNETFSTGLAAINENGKWGYINKTGEIVIPLIYDKALKFSEGVAFVKKNGIYSFIDTKGKEVLEYKFGYSDLVNIGKFDIGFSPCFSEGLCPVIQKDMQGMGFIDKEGRLVIDSHFSYADGFVNNYSEVYLNQKKFLMDRYSAAPVIDPSNYESIERLSNSNLFLAKKESKKSIILDKTGKVLSNEF